MVEAFPAFWLNVCMPPPNAPPGSNFVQNLPLNDKIILTAKEASRRHDEVAACFKERLEPKDIVSFKFQSVEQATLTEHLLCEITAVRFRNPVNIDGFRCLAVVWWVEVEQAPVKWAFSQRA